MQFTMPSRYFCVTFLVFTLLFSLCHSEKQEKSKDSNSKTNKDGKPKKITPHPDHNEHGDWKWDEENQRFYMPKQPDFFTFNVTDIDGNEVSLEKYRGMAVIVVNVASQCGYTENHYTQLVEIQKEYAPTNKFTIIGFPCNQFGAQEPGTNKEIKEFALEKYGVNFPMMAKVDVIGENASPVYRYLTRKFAAPEWNFNKYLVDAEGQVRGAYEPSWVPMKIKHLIKQLVHEAIAITNPEDPNNPHGFHHGEL